MQAAYLYQYLEKSGTKRNILIFLVAVIAINLLFSLVYFNWGHTVSSITSEEQKIQILDLCYGYSPDFAYEMIGAYGPEKRQLYLITILTLDMIYPFVYGTLLIWGSIRLLKKSYPWLLNDLYKLTFIPVLTIVADILENTSIASMLIGYPHKLTALAHIGNFFTMLKWISIMLILTLYILGVIAYWMNHRQTAEYEEQQKG